MVVARRLVVLRVDASRRYILLFVVVSCARHRVNLAHVLAKHTPFSAAMVLACFRVEPVVAVRTFSVEVVGPRMEVALGVSFLHVEALFAVESVKTTSVKAAGCAAFTVTATD
jgi:hypothetical protein